MFSNNRLKFLLTVMTVSNLGLLGMSQTFKKAWKNQKDENEKMAEYFSALLDKYGLVPDEHDLLALNKMGVRLKSSYAGQR